MFQRKLQSLSISVILAVLVAYAIIHYGSTAFAQQSQTTSSSQTNNTLANTTGATTNKTALLKPGPKITWNTCNHLDYFSGDPRSTTN
jgi:hypothetical protein